LLETGHENPCPGHLAQKSISAALTSALGQKRRFLYDSHNPADPHTATVSGDSIRGQTDQFILRFSKPKK
jgi:predicted methyltransferase